MSFELEDLTPRYRIGVFTPTDPLVVEWNPTSADSRNFVLAIAVTAVTGAGPIYATQSVETTWDDGASWDVVTGVELQDVTATGRWLAYATAIMSPISPRCRLVVTPVAAHTITVETIKRSKHAPGDAPSSSPPNTTGGITTVTISNPIGQTVMADSVSVAIASDQSALPLDVEFAAGVVTADTIRTTPASDSPHLLATRHEAVATPIAVRESDGTDFLSSIALIAAQMTMSVANAIKQTASVVFGWDGTDHREMRVETTGELRIAGLIPEKYEAVTIAYPLATQETYQFFEDAAKTISICTITVDYSDGSKVNMTSVVRT